MMKPGFATRCLIWVAALLTLPTLSFASNQLGADLTYDYLGNGQYRIELKSYGLDAAAPQSVVVSLFSASCGVTQSLNLQQEGVVGVSPDCKTKPGAKAGGVVEHTYSATVSLQQCTDWVFSYSEPGGGKNGQMNLADPTTALYVSATLNNVVAPENSSPKFSIAPTPYFPMGLPFTFNQGALDKNGNTLVYSLVEALSDANTPVAYQPGFNAALPLSTYNGAFDFNPYTGAFTVKADAPQTALVALLVQEFDANGHLIGSVTRHIGLNVTNAVKNNLPGFAPIANYAGGVYNRTKNTFSVRNGETLSFSFNAFDADAAQAVSITSNADQSTPGAKVDITGNGNGRMVNYTWTAPAKGTGFYNVAFQVSDNATPVGFQTVSYNIYVTDAPLADGDKFIEPAALRPLADVAAQNPGSAAGGTFEKAPVLANAPAAKPNGLLGGDYVDVTPQNPQLCAGQGQGVQLNAVLYVNGVPIPSCSGTYTSTPIPFNPTVGQGTAVQLSDDQVSGALPIGFDFQFYCNTYNQFYLGSNGFITFSPNQPSGCCSGQFLPNAATPNNLIAAAWDDLYPPGAGSVTYFTSGVAPNRILIVNWTDVPFCCGNLPQVTTQIKLFEGTNIIEIHNTSIQNISPGTQGIEDLNGVNAVVVPGRNAAAWNATNDAYRFTPGSTVTFAWSPVTGLSDPNIGTPVASPLVTTTYTVTATQNGVTATGTVTVSLVAPVNAGFDIPDALCYNEPPLNLDNFLLPGATPGGVWTGDGVTGNIFDPAAAGNGLHIITYTVGVAPCIDIVNDTIGIYDPSVTIETDPAAPPYCGQVVLNAISGGGVGPFNGDAYYLRSQNAFGEPWGSQSNIQAMDAEFGPGNWISDYFEAVNPNIVFSQATDLVWMEGSDGHANALNTFLAANIALIENWVTTGGRLFINAAPNQGGTIQCGFGGVSLNYPDFSPNVAAVLPLHPIYLGPFLPTANNYTGNFYGHATVAGPGLTTIMTGNNNNPMVSLKPWGNGITVFGGMTTTNWHTPQQESQNFRQNILDWMKNYNNAPPFGYLWNNGETTESITVTQSGTYTVTVTAAQNCTATATINVTVFPDVNIQFLTDSVFCVGGILGVTGLDGTAPYTYQWNNGETGDQIIVFISDDYTAVVTDANGCQDSVTVDVTVGQPVVATILTDPALPACGEVTLIADGTGGGGNLCNGDKYYIRSQNAFGEPWGHQSNPQAMDANFGAGNWISDYFETVNVGNMLSNNTCFIMMEGSDGHALAMNSFVTANLAAIENWVDNGGRLFMNAAPNQGGVMNWGFGGVTCNYVPGLTWIPNVAAAVPLHPVFNGPFLPTAQNMSGNYYAHATVPGGGAVPILTDAGNAVGPVLAMLDWGGGRVAFGGITTSPWHNPSVESQNLRQNVIDYLVNTPTANCTYLWNTGETTQEIVANQPGLYEVTITCTGGCSDSASLQLAIFPGVDINVTTDTVFCTGGIIGVQGSGGLPPFTYEWDNGDTNDSIIVFISDIYGATVTDANGCQDSIDIDVTVGQPVVAAITTDPANPPFCGEVTLIADGTGGGGNACNGDKYYIRSQNAFGEPWGHQSNPQAMDAVFGAGNWISEFYETVNVANLFTNNTCLIFMEGSDGHALAMNTFVTANLTDMENWVDNGGRLFLNAAPNQGGIMNWGFGGVTCNYVPGVTWIPNVGAPAGPLHPVFAGSFQPTTPNMSGNYYAHATVPGGGAVPILQDAGGAIGPVISMLDWGGGRVAFGGITTSPWHNPSLESQNLRQNVIEYLYLTPTANCTYLWNTGETTQTITATADGQYCVTITCTGGCSDSTCINVSLLPAPEGHITGGPNFCVGGILCDSVSGGVPPYTYQWNNGETTDCIIVFNSDTYIVTTTGANGCQDIDTVNTIISQPFNANIVTNPANPPFCGNVDLVAVTDGFNQGGTGYYLRSQNAFGEPWGSQSNIQAMDAVFGPGNWVSEYFESVNVAACFSPAVAVVFMEGSDGHALAMDAFVNANITAIENYVAGGGRIFMNAAPNQGGVMNWGFGGVQCNYVPGVTWIPNVTAAAPGHPMFAGPFVPTALNFSGNYYAHATVVGPGLTDLVVDVNGVGAVTSELSWGNGIAVFGGITTANWHTPSLESQNVRQNILDYLLNAAGTFTYQWDNGDTTQISNVDSSGTYCVTVTNVGGCTASACITVQVEPSPLITITGGPDFCGPGQLTANITGGTPPYIYTWDTGENLFTIDVTTSGTYCFYAGDAVGACFDTLCVDVQIHDIPQLTLTMNPANGQSCDSVAIDAEVVGGGAQGGGDRYYIRTSFAFGEPWGQQVNIQAMDATFGPGNWISEFYETVNPAALFSPATGFIFMEGSDSHADEMNAFIQANVTAMENWVDNGGHLFINAAPNEGGNINCHFGGITINYPNYSPNSNALAPAHPIYQGPFTPVALNYTGNYFGHATISGAGLTDLMAGVNGLSVLSSKPWGLGQVFFGGMTTPNFHTPLPDAQNFRQNILDYVATYVTFTYTYVWNTGDTTQDLTATQTGTYCVTVTAGNGCTSSSCVDVVIGGGLTITPVVICDLSGTTYTVEMTISGGAGTYIVDGVPIVGNVFVSGVFNAGDPYQFIVSDGGPCPPDTISGIGVCNQPQPCEPTGCLGPNLVQDPGFENFAPGAFFTSDYDYSACPGLCVNGVGTPILCSYDYTVSNDPDACNPDWIDVIPDHTTGTGNMLVVDFPTGDVGAGNNEIWCQTITVDSAVNYCFGGWFLNPILPGTGLSEPALEFTVNGASIGNTPLITEDGQWHHHGISFNSGGSTSVTLCINNANFGQLGFDLVMDDIALYDLTPQNPPTAADDAVTFCENGGAVPQVLNVVANDQDGSFPIDLTTFAILVGPNAADGVAVADVATGDITFTPAIGFAGTASVTYQICDANGCCDSATVTFTQNPNPVFTTASTPSDCGTNTGTATVVETFAGYLWGDGQTTQTATGLPIGQACVTVTDANSCTATACVAVPGPNGFAIVVTASDSTICAGSSTDLIATVTGGIAPITYLWDNGGTDATITVNPVVTTTYVVTVTDGQSCTATGTVTITISEVALAITNTPALCNGACDGTMTITASGGLAPYTYELYDAAGTLVGSNQTGSFTGLCAGNYSISVSDAGAPACTAAALDTITQPTALTVTTSSTPANCGAAGTATVTVDPGAGTGPYTYLWSTGETTATAINLGLGDVTVTVTDANGCTTTAIVTITGGPAVTFTYTATATTCGNANGAILVTPVTGVAPFNYTWNPVLPNTPNPTGLAGGDYALIVTDANNCTEVALINVAPSLPLSLQLTVTGTTCGVDNGSITVVPVDGTPGYTAVWNDPNLGNNLVINNLAPGQYDVTVTDNNGCTASSFGNVGASQPLVLTGVATAPECIGGSDGEIATTATPVGPVYTYTWTGGAVGPNPTGLTAGTYDVIVTDGVCTATGSYVVPEGLIVDVNAGPDVTIAAGDTAMLVAISQPAGIVTWTDDQGGTYSGDTIWVTPTVTTTYTATLAVGNCIDADDVVVIISYNNDFAVPNAFSPNGDGINDAFMPVVADDQSMIIVEFKVWNRWGQEVYSGSGPNAAWNGSFKDQPQSRDMYIWSIKFQRPDGVETTRTGEVMLIR